MLIYEEDGLISLSLVSNVTYPRILSQKRFEHFVAKSMEGGVLLEGSCLRVTGAGLRTRKVP